MIKEIRVVNVKSFDQQIVKTDKKINIFCGKNNSGKSTILHSIMALNGSASGIPVRIGTAHSEIEFLIDGEIFAGQIVGNPSRITFLIDGQASQIVASSGCSFKGAKAGESVIYYYFSAERPAAARHELSAASTRDASTHSANISAKVDAILGNREHPDHERLREVFRSVMGFYPSSTAYENGKKPSKTIRGLGTIFIDAMGSGVNSFLKLVVDLIGQEKAIFIIEEMENDLHPSAIRELCRLIKEATNRGCQFFLSTHSNIVVRELIQRHDLTNVFSVSVSHDKDIPRSSVAPISNPTEISHLLEDMGYDCYDIGMYKLWIVFEESSAERFYRDFLLRWCFPNELPRIRTVSSGGCSKSKKTFDSINDIFKIFHICSVFKDRVIVRIDSGDTEKSIIDEMINRYGKSGWSVDLFGQFGKVDFEEYLPSPFLERFLSAKGARERNENKYRDEKKAIFEDFVNWANDHETEARSHFESVLVDEISYFRKIITRVFKD